MVIIVRIHDKVESKGVADECNHVMTATDQTERPDVTRRQGVCACSVVSKNANRSSGTISRCAFGIGLMGVPMLAAGSEPNVAAIIVNTMSAMNQAGAGLAGKLVSVGEQFAAVLFALMFAWQVLQGIMEQRLDALIRNILALTLSFTIVMMMLNSWGTANGMGIRGFVVDGMNSLSAPFAQNGADPTDRVVDQYSQAIQACISLIARAVAYLPDFSLDTLSAYLYSLLLVVMISAVAGLCVYTLVIALAFNLLYINQGAFIVYIGLAVGPVFVALLLFPPGNGFFNRWVDFIISGGVLKLVSVLVSALLAALFANLQTSGTQLLQLVTQQAIQTGTFDVTGFLAWCLEMLFWAFFSYQLVKEIPSFAHALSGGARGGITSLANVIPGGIDSALGGAKGKVLDSVAGGMKSVAGGVARPVVQAAGAVKAAAVAGMDHATGGLVSAAVGYRQAQQQGRQAQQMRAEALQAAREKLAKTALKDWAEEHVAQENKPPVYRQAQQERTEQTEKAESKRFKEKAVSMANALAQERAAGERE